MSDQANSLKEDISFMRRLAEQGRQGPLLGGVFLAAAGLIYGSASLIDWGTATGHLAISPVIGGNLWIGASLLFAVVWVVLFLRLRSAGEVKTGAAQFAFGTAWASSGLGIVVMIGAVAILSNRLHDPMLLYINALTAFAFYGAAWSVSAALTRQRWMLAIAVAAFGITLLLALTSGTANELLVLGTGLFATLFVPGLKLALQTAR